MTFIYYASPLHVDQLYKACIGEAGQRTLTTESDAGTSASAEVGLAKLFAAIADLRGKGSVELRRKRVETLHTTQSLIDRAQAVLKALETRVPPLEKRGKGLLWYSLPTRLAPIKRGHDVVIEVSCEQDDLVFSGFTSTKHWVSPSLQNNLLMAVAKSPDRAIPTFGIVLPIDTDSTGARMSMQVQFIIIASPDTWAT